MIHLNVYVYKLKYSKELQYVALLHKKKKTIESQCMSITFQTHSGNHWIMGSAIQIRTLKRNLLQLFSSDYLAKYHCNTTLNKQRKSSITKIEEIRQKKKKRKTVENILVISDYWILNTEQINENFFNITNSFIQPSNIKMYYVFSIVDYDIYFIKKN